VETPVFFVGFSINFLKRMPESEPVKGAKCHAGGKTEINAAQLRGRGRRGNDRGASLAVVIFFSRNIILGL
jgi:hypothetical protein